MPKDPMYKQVSWKRDSCFNAIVYKGRNLTNTWHYHPEIELILLRGSRGTRIVGNSVETFGDNELLLIGKNTPHAFLHEEKYLNAGDPAPEALVLQFGEGFLGDEFLRLPDLSPVNDLLIRSRQGLCITEAGKEVIIPLMERIFQVPSFDGIILLLEILKCLTKPGTSETLAKSDVYNYVLHANDKRFDRILEYTYENYDEHISIEDVAKIANLTKESFCRYFKMRVNKTYLEFLTEYRISKACQMIRKSDMSMKEIGYSAGFESLSNFYYQFRKIMKMSPLTYCGKNRGAGIATGLLQHDAV